jgi:hypothetical protein
MANRRQTKLRKSFLGQHQEFMGRQGLLGKATQRGPELPQVAPVALPGCSSSAGEVRVGRVLRSTLLCPIRDR